MLHTAVQIVYELYTYTQQTTDLQQVFELGESMKDVICMDSSLKLPSPRGLQLQNPL